MNEAAIQLAYNYFIYPPQVGEIVVPKIEIKPKSSKLAKILATIGFAFLIFYFTPIIFNSIIQGNESILMDSESERLLAAMSGSQEENYQPAIDTNLPLGSYLKIPSIGVNTQIGEQSYATYEEALKKGAWRVPDYATPDNQNMPMILAAHRFGYLAWSNGFRREHSFFNLPKLKSGDTVEVIWNQRKYVYAIYGESQGTEVSDYSADLVLYTCIDLSSDMRIFRYAKLLRN